MPYHRATTNYTYDDFIVWAQRVIAILGGRVLTTGAQSLMFAMSGPWETRYYINFDRYYQKVRVMGYYRWIPGSHLTEKGIGMTMKEARLAAADIIRRLVPDVVARTRQEQLRMAEEATVHMRRAAILDGVARALGIEQEVPPGAYEVRNRGVLARLFGSSVSFDFTVPTDKAEAVASAIAPFVGE